MLSKILLAVESRLPKNFFQISKELQIVIFTLKRQCTKILRPDHCHMDHHSEFLEEVP